MTISVTLTDAPVGVTVSANAGSVSVSAATVTAVQVGIGDTFIPATHGGTHATEGSDPVLLTPDQIDTIANEGGALYYERYNRLSQWMLGVDDALLNIDTQLSGNDWQGFWVNDVSYPIGGIVVHRANLWRRIGAEGAGFEPIAGSAYWQSWYLTSRLDAKASATHSHAASDITSGTIATARLASGAASASNFLRGDQTWAEGSLLNAGSLLDGGAF